MIAPAPIETTASMTMETKSPDVAQAPLKEKTINAISAIAKIGRHRRRKKSIPRQFNWRWTITREIIVTAAPEKRTPQAAPIVPPVETPTNTDGTTVTNRITAI